LQLDARSRVRMPCAGSDRATNTRSIETGLFLTPRLAPTLRPSCGGVQAACAAAVDASSRRSVLVAATTVAFAGLFAECEGQHGVMGGGSAQRTLLQHYIRKPTLCRRDCRPLECHEESPSYRLV
jgi:hypothetical protein